METFWQYFLASAKHAWLDYWLPIKWLFPKKYRTAKELASKEELSTHATSLWWIIATTLTSAMLASGAFYLVALYMPSQDDGMIVRRFLTMILSLVWTMSALRIGFFLYLRKD